ncbi:MAG: aldolase, partial [Sphaerochaetaceae bacterium]|nr:aldolase [Sphaerochaetaceae bacterium]
MKRRMNNILRKDGKTFILAMDHAAIMPSPDLTNPGKIITEAIAGGVDGFLTTYGIIKNFSSSFGNAGIIMRADGGLSTIRKPMAPMELIYSAEDAIRVGADAMLCMG